VQNADDGVLCGVDDCTADEVDVCLSGQCVKRARPNTGKCANTWLPVTLNATFGHAMAYDEARKVTLLFGGSATFADTWIFDGTKWTVLTPTNSPPGRSRAAMAYDRARRRMVLFGGTGLAGDLSDTWEFDGTTWLLRNPQQSPTALQFGAMAYDSRLGHSLLVGVNPAGVWETWAFNGNTWTSLHASIPQMSGPYDVDMAYDESRGRMALVYRDTHLEFNGAIWVALPQIPGSDPYSAVAYDSVRNKLVLHKSIGEPLEFNGTSWTPIHVTQLFEHSYGEAMVFDRERNLFVFFGGPSSTGTWVLTGNRFEERTKSPPMSVFQVPMTFDSSRAEVLYPTAESNTTLSLDTWVFKDFHWEQRAPVNSPQRRFRFSLVFDSQRNKAVLFGGSEGSVFNSADFNDTWEWNGANWNLQTVPLSPPKNIDLSFVFDAAVQKSILFGSGTGLTNDTWRWNGTIWEKEMSVENPAPSVWSMSYFDAVQQQVISLAADANQSALVRYSHTPAGWTSVPVPVGPRVFQATGAFDSDRHVGVILDGNRETWELSGLSWIQRMPIRSPPSASVGQMVYDAQRKRIFLFIPSGVWMFLP
jgi:hypothetical protein